MLHFGVVEGVDGHEGEQFLSVIVHFQVGMTLLDQFFESGHFPLDVDLGLPDLGAGVVHIGEHHLLHDPRVLLDELHGVLVVVHVPEQLLSDGLHVVPVGPVDLGDVAQVVHVYLGLQLGH